MDKQKRLLSKNNSNNWLTYTGMVFEMFSIIGIFTVIGYFLDKKLQCSPTLLIVFLLIGFTISFYRIYISIFNKK